MAALKETAGSYMNGDGTVALSLARSEESKLSALAKLEENRGVVLAPYNVSSYKRTRSPSCGQ